VLTIEVPLLRSSIANGDYAWEGALVSAYHVSSRMLAQAGDEIGLDDYVANRQDFHRKLFSACENQWLLWSWSLLYAQQLRFRHTFAELARYERGLHEDYRAFLEVVIERDVEHAVALWTENQAKIVAFIEAHLRPEVQSVQAGIV
jgi:GntR family carbon starvation induced transcriptional regulator